MKKISLFLLSAILSASGIAQKKTFDVVSYTAPKGWQQQQNEGGIQLSVTDKKTGGYAIAIITKSTASTASANENFNADWNRLVKATVQVNDEPAMQEPTNDKGWEIISGAANYTENNNTGVATLLTATGGSQMASVLLMTNTSKYQDELLLFLNSLELSKATQSETSNTASGNNGETNKSSIAGLWTYYTLETTGYYINGMPQYTAGYLRSEYAFNADGTYIYRTKQWLVKAVNIVFGYESGTYSVRGNQITLTPTAGRSGFWKKTNSSKEWGSQVKLSNDKLGKTVYTYQIIADPNYNSTTIELKSTDSNKRDGKYTFRDSGSMIDNSPGVKIK